MPPTRNFGLLAIKKQAAPDVPESTFGAGAYAFPIMSGGLAPNYETAMLPRQGATMTRLGQYAQRKRMGGTVTIMAHPDGLGLLLKQVMGSELALGTVASGITPHTFVMADSYPFPLTVWDSRGSGSDSDVWRYSDAYVARLAINGQSGNIFEVELEVVSKKYQKVGTGLAGWPAGAAPTGSVLAGSEPRFKYIGSQVKMDSDSATPILMPNVESFTWEVARDPEIRFGSSVSPTTFAPDRMVNFRAGAVYDSAYLGWDFLEDSFVSGYGVDPDQSQPAGSFDIIAGVHPSGATSPNLRIVSGGGAGLGGPTPTVAVQQNWEYTVDRPDASGEPALLEYEANGIVRAPAAGTTETAVILGSSVVAAY